MSQLPPLLASRFDGRLGAHIGHGGQADVYELDADKVLRVYWAAFDDIGRLAAAYESLDRASVPFAVPEIMEYGEIDGRDYSVDRRLPGRPLIDVLPELTGEGRRRALDSYIEAAHQVARLRPGGSPGGWRSFLRDETLRQAERLRGQLVEDVAQFAQVLDDLLRRIDVLAEPPTPGLVHGDYFPGNVLVNPRGEVSAVIDFDMMSAGDPLMDITGGAFFLEVQRRFEPSDAAYVLAELERRHGRGIHDVAETYRRWYAVHFAHSKGVDERLYGWCIGILSA